MWHCVQPGENHFLSIPVSALDSVELKALRALPLTSYSAQEHCGPHTQNVWNWSCVQLSSASQPAGPQKVLGVFVLSLNFVTALKELFLRLGNNRSIESAERLQTSSLISQEQQSQHHQISTWVRSISMPGWEQRRHPLSCRTFNYKDAYADVVVQYL